MCEIWDITVALPFEEDVVQGKRNVVFFADILVIELFFLFFVVDEDSIQDLKKKKIEPNIVAVIMNIN